jgi:hypothetical protein
MRPTLKGKLLKAICSNGWHLGLWWIDIKYAILEWVLLKTYRLRFKLSKRIVLTSHAYWDGRPVTCEDVEIEDQWGFWLPLGFMLQAQSAFDEENRWNDEHGYGLEPWADYVEGGWPIHRVRADELLPKHFFEEGKKHMKLRMGDLYYDKDFEYRVTSVSDKWLDDEKKRWAEWEAAGRPPFKIAFAEGAKEDFKEILGEDDAQKFFEKIDLDNKTKDIIHDATTKEKKDDTGTSQAG